MKKNMEKIKRGGFTLIELLVVIAIIGILGSVVFASLNNARKKAFRSQLLQQFREIQKAADLYLASSGTNSYPANAYPVGNPDFGSFVWPTLHCTAAGASYGWINTGTEYGGSGGTSGACVGIFYYDTLDTKFWLLSEAGVGGCDTHPSRIIKIEDFSNYVADRCY